MGELLAPGTFSVRGRKNFLPPNPLVMGFGYLFRVDAASAANHVGERRILYGADADSSLSFMKPYRAPVARASSVATSRAPSGHATTGNVATSGADAAARARAAAGLRPQPPQGSAANAEANAKANTDAGSARDDDDDDDASGSHSSSGDEAGDEAGRSAGHGRREAGESAAGAGAHGAAAEVGAAASEGQSDREVDDGDEDAAVDDEDAAIEDTPNDALNAFLDGALGGADGMQGLAARHDRCACHCLSL